MKKSKFTKTQIRKVEDICRELGITVASVYKGRGGMEVGDVKKG